MRNAIKRKVQTKCYVNWKKKPHQDKFHYTDFLGQSKLFGALNTKYCI